MESIYNGYQHSTEVGDIGSNISASADPDPNDGSFNPGNLDPDLANEESLNTDAELDETETESDGYSTEYEDENDL